MTRRPPASSNLVLASACVLPVSSEPLCPGWVAIEDSAIVAVGDGPPPANRGPVHDYAAAIIIPGLVNAHTHLACGVLQGAADDLSFFDWLTAGVAPRVIDTMRENPEAFLSAARGAAAALLGGGVTTVADSFLDDAGRLAMHEAGLRGVYYREFFGARSRDLDDYVAESLQRIADDQGDREDGPVGYGIAPHALYTCPAKVLRALADEAARSDLPMTLHLDESEEEHRFFADGEGPMHSMFARDGDRNRYEVGQTPVELLERWGLLCPRLLLVHATQLTDSDLDRIARAGASIVHCPGSNSRLAVGVAPVAEMLEKGINVALGTDSLASSGRLDMFEEMRLALLGQRGRTRKIGDLTAETALRMATINGARALGLEDRCGSLEPGKRADVTVVARPVSPSLEPIDPASSVVWSSSPADVIAVWIDGRPRYERVSK